MVLTEISIHAPRVGSDFLKRIHSFNSSIRFLSTLPAWGATRGSGKMVFDWFISIHAPRVGSDHIRTSLFRRIQISIHAPRVGSDC